MIIGISGRIGSGKDTVGKIIQYLTSNYYKSGKSFAEFNEINTRRNDYPLYLDWQIKKFAGKLKQIVSILTGIPVEDLEKQEVKDSNLPECWNSDYDEHYYKGYPQTYNIRLLLQRVGTEAMRNVIHPNIWVNALFADYKIEYIGGIDPYKIENEVSDVKIFNIYPNWIITDVRFPNEMQAVKNRNGITIRVNRDKNVQKIEHRCKADFIDGKYYVPKKSMMNIPEEYKGKLIPNDTFVWYTLKNDLEHPSETALDSAEFDEVIDNNEGIPELIEKVKEILIRRKLLCT